MVLSAALVSVSCRSGGGQDEGAQQLPGIQPSDDTAMAEGGDLSFVRSGSDWDELHVFTSGGTLKVNRAPDADTVRVLVVAGGGGGNQSNGAPGGSGIVIVRFLYTSTTP
jgi:hypothetical protein